MVSNKPHIKNHRMRQQTTLLSMQKYSEFEYNSLSHKLSERVKELECLYNISRIAKFKKNDLTECLQEIVSEIPKGWQFPERVSAHLSLGEQYFGTPPTHKHQKTTFQMSNGVKGELFVYYKTVDSGAIDQPFLFEEQFLLNQIGHEIHSLVELDLKQKNEKIIQEKLKSEDKINLLGEITAGIAHELNTPLANILGYSELLLKEEKDKEKVTDLEKVIKSAKHAVEIVKKLMFFSCDMPSSYKEVDLNTLIKDNVNLLKLQLNDKSIHITFHLEEDLPMMKIDPVQFAQVLFNIILNAIDAMEVGGRLVISTRRIQNEIRLAISDNGIGMNEEELKALFQPFYSKKRHSKGTGLGLAVSHGIVQAHGGRIEVSSTPNRGTTFTIILQKP